MKIAIFGLGYVGFTALCCIAQEGHRVVGIDVNPDKVAAILAGTAPIKEPGVDAMLVKGLADGLIHATSSPVGELDDCDLAIVCVGTPSGADGGHDMRYIIDVTRQIAGELKPGRAQPLTVAFRSTIRPGTLDELIHPIFRSRLGDATDDLVELVYNPEFLREATAVHDYFHPPKIVVGTRDGQPSATMDALHANLDAPVFYVGFRESEITKFVDNTWHAVKVAYANEIGRVCMALGISASKMHEIFVSDTKLNISSYYTRPGGAFGGSCLPKDVRALQRIAADSGANTYLVDSLLRSNEAHKYAMFRAAIDGLAPGAKVLVAGLAFKAKTDDLRESPNVDLVRMMLAAGYDVLVYDPAVDATQLVGANLGYVYTRIPRLEALLISAEAAEAGDFDRIILTNATGLGLRVPPEKCLDIATIK
ncbi:nucleotide sugar dehydrogenase [Novosphingobium sp. FSW06-99]|uniref:nucleotide sugar dehydrogenase n=1 Tax=Novosphingobium sp. FSW06-99 TaxID=1739113 RepID=UPI00076D5D34|nr:nucleotide sugar dehydrogenase [Novosphingobium sp. FSW06-99]KUR80124.1 GDP-mannose dehydrogenase [Novosphingobium sp. FSW06-99]